MLDLVSFKAEDYEGLLLVVSDEAICLYADRDFQLGLEPLCCMTFQGNAYSYINKEDDNG